MTHSIVLQKIRKNQTVFSLKCCYADPELIEIMGRSRFDCLWICLEHRKLDATLLDCLIRSCRLAGVDALFRVKPGAHSDLLYLLEAGVQGIMIPQVRHLNEIKQVIETIKFQPLGKRGLDMIHADSDFGTIPPVQYIRSANENTFLVVQVETPEVVEHLDDIASLEGVDALFVGPGDLSANLGVIGQDDHPEVQKIIKEVARVCARHDKVAAIPCSPDRISEYHALGFRFFNTGSDFRFIQNGLKSATDALDSISDLTAPS